ncbi:hypothetical protein [Nocardia nova]|uniref:hypothetical protein n=1 Tax=Nocardia nova TaxID=37330 RepID=UPI0015E47CAA|nr:hypothetical protein [Nocardia nova]
MSATTNKVVAQGFPVVPEMGRQLARRIGRWAALDTYEHYIRKTDDFDAVRRSMGDD